MNEIFREKISAVNFKFSNCLVEEEDLSKLDNLGDISFENCIIRNTNLYNSSNKLKIKCKNCELDNIYTSDKIGSVELYNNKIYNFSNKIMCTNLITQGTESLVRSEKFNDLLEMYDKDEKFANSNNYQKVQILLKNGGFEKRLDKYVFSDNISSENVELENYDLSEISFDNINSLEIKNCKNVNLNSISDDISTLHIINCENFILNRKLSLNNLKELVIDDYILLNSFDNLNHLDKLTLNNMEINNLELLERIPNLKVLDLTNCKLNGFNDYNFGNLNELTLNSTDINETNFDKVVSLIKKGIIVRCNNTPLQEYMKNIKLSNIKSSITDNVEKTISLGDMYELNREIKTAYINENSTLNDYIKFGFNISNAEVSISHPLNNDEKIRLIENLSLLSGNIINF